ncbi:MAG: NfeD family protein [Verrucomicrobiota bacterium]
MTILITLLVVGYLLILAEILVPGGILGIIGILALLAAAIYSFNTFGTSVGLVVVLGELISGAIIILLWMKYFFDSPFGKVFVLKEEKEKSDDANPADENFDQLLQQKGITLTRLRPSGTIKIDSKRYDALSEGRLIEKDIEVTVVKIEGNHIFVRETQPNNH